MAFWDFMSEPVGEADMAAMGGGAYDMSATSTPSGALPELAAVQGGAPATIGGKKPMTWGDLMKAMVGMSGPYPGYNVGAMGGAFMPQGGNVYPIGPTADFGQPQTAGKGNQTDVQEVMSIASLFAGGAGGGVGSMGGGVGMG